MAETHTPDTPPRFDPTQPPSSSLLFYLYADRVVPTARLGTRAPLADVRVSTARLACTLFAVAFWHLRESGFVRLEVMEERKFLKTTTHLRVTRAADGQRDGIEGGILDLLTQGSRGKLTPAWEAMPNWVKQQMALIESALPYLPKDLPRPTGSALPKTAHEVVNRWYGSAIPSPESLPISWTQREGVAKGYLTVEDANRNPVAAFFVGKTTHVPQREKIAALEPMFAQLLARWQAFTTNEGALASQLDREIVAGIEASRDTSDSSS